MGPLSPKENEHPEPKRNIANLPRIPKRKREHGKSTLEKRKEYKPWRARPYDRDHHKPRSEALDKIRELQRSARQVEQAIKTTLDDRLMRTCGLQHEPVRKQEENRAHERRLKSKWRREFQKEQEEKEKKEKKEKEEEERRKEKKEKEKKEEKEKEEKKKKEKEKERDEKTKEGEERMELEFDDALLESPKKDE